MSFPDILLVAQKLELKHKKSGIGSEYYICPFCDDKAGHLNVLVGSNVWRCSRCGEGGGVIDLIQKAGNMTRTQAKKYAFSLTDASDNKPVSYQPRYRESENTTPIASKKTIDETYRTMLSLLNICKQDEDDLQKRGLSKQAIQHLNIRSAPELNNHDIPNQLLEMGCTLTGVPGFYVSQKGEWTLNNYVYGYMIPFIDTEGFMTGIQIRDRDPKKSSCKYLSLSSNGLPYGAKSIVPAHYIGCEKPEKAPIILLTEGALKADVSAYLFWKKYRKRVSILAIPGVNHTKALLNALNYIRICGGNPFLYDAFDMDKCGSDTVAANPNVKKAIQKVYELCKQNGFSIGTMKWKTGKGLDDFLLEHKH